MGKMFLRRRDAGRYLREKFGFCSEKSLAKMATMGGGPAFRKAGPAVLYELDELDRWALAKIGAPQSSTSSRAA